MNTSMFEKKGIIAVPLLQPANDPSMGYMFSIAAVSEEHLMKHMSPRNRSTVMIAFAVWRSLRARVADDNGTEGGDFDAEMANMLFQSRDDFDAMQPFMDRSMEVCRKAWPYETFLVNQAIVGTEDWRAMFACYPNIAGFPDLLPPNQIGVSRSIVFCPSMSARVNMHPMSPNQIHPAVLHQMITGGASVSPLAIVPGGSGNALFDHEYVGFATKDQK